MKKSWREILDAPDEFWEMSSEEKARICNGVGPAHWPKKARELLDSPWLGWGMSFRPSADIHDVGYEKGKTAADKIREDKRFRDNNRALVRHFTSRWRFVLYRRRMLVANGLYLAVKYGGDDAFWASKEGRPDDGEET